jgi:hypothetical protein
LALLNEIFSSEKVIIRYIGAGELTAAVALLMNLDYPVTAEAVEATGVAAVKSGVIKRFVVMAGCDGRQKTGAYFTKRFPNADRSRCREGNGRKDPILHDR